MVVRSVGMVSISREMSPTSQPRQGRDRFRGVRFGLKPLEHDRLPADPFLRLRGERALETGHPLPDRLLPLLLHGPARFHDGEEPVGVFEEPPSDDPLEEGGVRLPLPADFEDGAGEIQVGQGIPVVQPGVVGAPHQNDPVGVGAADHLPSVEFDLVEGPLDQFRGRSRLPPGFAGFRGSGPRSAGPCPGRSPGGRPRRRSAGDPSPGR